MEETAMMMILHSGNANQLAFSALRKVKSKEFEEAKALIKQAKDESLESHKLQTSLLTTSASGKKVEMDILLVHAQDHLMNSVLAIDLIEEMIDVFESYQ